MIGSGVAGLTAALELAARGERIVIYADRAAAPPASLVAPALFTPYPPPAASDPGDARFRRWTEHAYSALARIAAEHGPGSGIRMGELREYFYEPPTRRPWLDALLSTSPIRPVPAPFVESTSSLRPHIDMLRYMPWLEQRARSAGVRFIERRITKLDEVFALGHSTVINCAGVGARSLAADPLVRPMHGQVVHVPNTIGLTYSLHDDAAGPDGKVAYIFVFDDRLVLGGTFDEGRDDHRTDRAAIDGVIERCRNLLRLDGHPRWSEIARSELRVLAAVRPTRGAGSDFEQTRVEREELAGGTVIHCYGHGRSGATVSWATAAEAAALALHP